MARPRLGDSESKRLQMVITEKELDAIDEWQHANRISSRSEAIRRLCQMALRYDREEIGMTGGLQGVADALDSTGKAWREARKRSAEPAELLEIVKDQYRKLMRATNVLMIRAQVGRLQSAAMRRGDDMETAQRLADEKRVELEAEIEKAESRIK